MTQHPGDARCIDAQGEVTATCSGEVPGECGAGATCAGAVVCHGGPNDGELCCSGVDCEPDGQCSGCVLCNNNNVSCCAIGAEATRYATCDGGDRDGEACLTDVDCTGAAVCSGGSRDGLYCDCPDGVCSTSTKLCNGGSRDGESCECPGGSCDSPVCPSGTPQYIAMYDRTTETLSTPVLLGYGVSSAPDGILSGGSASPDGHNIPAITVDSQGYLHIVLGAHGAPFKYVRSTLPCTHPEWSIDAPGAWTAPVRVGAEGGCGPLENSYGSTTYGCNCDYAYGHDNALDRCFSRCGEYTYVSLLYDRQDRLHVVARWTGVSPARGNLLYRLVHLRAAPQDGEWQWEPQQDVVLPFHNAYSNWYHKLSVDRVGRLFLFYAYYSDQLSLDEELNYEKRWPEDAIKRLDNADATPCVPADLRSVGACEQGGATCVTDADCPSGDCILAPDYCTEGLPCNAVCHGGTLTPCTSDTDCPPDETCCPSGECCLSDQCHAADVCGKCEDGSPCTTDVGCAVGDCLPDAYSLCVCYKLAEHPPPRYSKCQIGACWDQKHDVAHRCSHAGVMAHDPVLLISDDGGDSWRIATTDDFADYIIDPAIPAVSAWGLGVLSIGLLASGCVLLRRRRSILDGRALR